jgi:hypothetical protein
MSGKGDSASEAHCEVAKGGSPEHVKAGVSKRQNVRFLYLLRTICVTEGHRERYTERGRER